MKTFKVTWEIELSAEDPHEAAKEAQKWLRDQTIDWVFEVEDSETKEKTMIDLWLPTDE